MIPISRPDLSSLEKQYINEAYDSTWVSSSGKFIELAETLVAEMAGTRFAVLTANGTVAIHLALLGVGIEPGDEVIVPSFTFISSVNAIRYCGAIPIFVDVDKENWTLNTTLIEKLITPKTKAILAVNLYGHPFDFVKVNYIAQKFNLKVVEDNAEAPGGKAFGKATGSLGDIGTFSFFGNKILTAGEGGAVTTNDESTSDRLKILRDHGMSRTTKYKFDVIGFNYRMTNISAALLFGQLQRFNELISHRFNLYQLYDEIVSTSMLVESQPISKWAEISPWLYPIVCISEEIKNKIILNLSSLEIETRPFFPPVHMQAPYVSSYVGDLGVTNDLSSRGFLLPTASNFSEVEISYLMKSVKSSIEIA